MLTKKEEVVVARTRDRSRRSRMLYWLYHYLLGISIFIHFYSEYQAKKIL